jgi:hypothetical protein
MTRLPAKVLSNEKRGEQYCVTVEIEVSDFRRSFNSLRFGDQIPFSGSCQDGTSAGDSPIDLANKIRRHHNKSR